MKRTNIYLDDDLFEDLRKEAYDNSTTISAVIRDRLRNTPNKKAPIDEIKIDAVSQRCEMPFCKQSAKGTYKVKSFNKETGDEISVDSTLCAFHYNQARKEGALSE